MSRRTDKVQSLLQHEVGDFLSHLELPSMTTISKVEVTADLKWGRVWITILGDEAEQKKVFKILKSNLAELQQGLIEKFDMKIVPRVKFIIDHAEEYAAHINELLRKTHE